MTLPPLPEPDTHCFDDDTGLDVWSHSPDQMHAYGEVCAAAERELVAGPQGEPMPGMSLMNRTIAYCAADTLRKLGYEWDGEAWVTTEPQAEPVRECADNDSPWLICKPCAAVGRCAKQAEPAAWLSLDDARLALWQAINKRDFGNPTDDKLILEALHKAGLWIARLDTHPPQQRKPLTDDQISNRLWEADWPEVMLSDFVRAKLRVFARAIERAHGIVEAP